MRGSITPYRGKPNAWWLRVYLGRDPATGKERYRSKVVHGPKRQAEKVLNQMVVEAEALGTTTSAVTIDRLLEEWLRLCEARGLSPRTLHDYQWHAHRRIGPALGKIAVDKLTVKDLDGYYGELRDQELSLATIRYTHAVLRQALGQAVKWGWIERNVALLATVMAPRPAPVIAPSPEQLRQIITAMAEHNPQFASLTALAALTGARRGELLALHWEDFDRSAHIMHIRANLVYTPETGTVLGPTKTKKNRRIALDALASNAVDVQMERLRQVAEKTGIPIVDNPWLFFGEVDGSKPIHPDSISKAFSRITKKLGIEGIHFHSLRHFTATQLIAAGVDIRTVSGRLGHANASMTLGIYSHVLDERDRQAGEIMGRLLSPRGDHGT